MRKAFYALGIATFFLAETAFAAGPAELQSFCSVAARLAKNPAVEQNAAANMLLRVAAPLCSFAWPPAQKTERLNPPFLLPGSLPYYHPSSYIPWCPNDAPPLELECGNAVPVTCTWVCWEDGGLKRYPITK